MLPTAAKRSHDDSLLQSRPPLDEVYCSTQRALALLYSHGHHEIKEFRAMCLCCWPRLQTLGACLLAISRVIVVMCHVGELRTFHVKACCTAPSLNPNNPHIKDPRKSERRALFSHGLIESCMKHGQAPDRRVLAYCSASTQRGKRAHADVCGEGVPRVQP